MRKINMLAAVAMSVFMMAGCANTSGTAQPQTEPAQTSGTETGEGTDAAVSEDKKVVLKLNHVQSNTDPVQEAFLELADMVKERSGGSIEIQVYANSELGSNKDNLEQVANGASIIAVGDTGFLAE